MSSMYSSQNTAPRCQRCGASLALNDPRCTNCGYFNGGPRLESSAPQQPQAPWNQPAQPESYRQTASPNQEGPRQEGGLLKRYPAQTEQRNHYTQQTSFPAAASQPQAASRPAAPQTSFNTMPPSQVRQQPNLPPSVAQPWHTLRDENSYPHPSSQTLNSNGYSQNASQATASSPYSTGPTTPPISFRASAQQVPPPMYAQAPRSFSQIPEKRRQLSIGRVVGILALLLVLIGGSVFAYTFLFAHKNTQQATNSSTSKSVSTPPVTHQGNPLFQDEFMNNTNGWSIQSYPSEFSVMLGDGALKLENDNNKLLWELVPGNQKYADFQLSVDATLSKGSQDNGYGVYIRGALSQNSSITSFYRFELYGDGSFAIFKGTTDTNSVLATSRLVDYTNNSAIQKQGGLNHITISAKGSSLQFIVNGQILSTVSDSTYTSGSIALFVSNLQKAPPGAVATFSHLAIYPAQK